MVAKKCYSLEKFSGYARKCYGLTFFSFFARKYNTLTYAKKRKKVVDAVAASLILVLAWQSVMLPAIKCLTNDVYQNIHQHGQDHSCHQTKDLEALSLA